MGQKPNWKCQMMNDQRQKLDALAARGGNRFLAHPVLTLLGDASYAMYILQAPLSGWYDFLLRNLFHVQAWTHHIWLLMAFFVGLILASVITFEFIEKPGRAAIRRLLTTDTSAKSNPLPAVIV